MAYMNQERKQQIAKLIKPLLKKYDIKGTLAVSHHSTIVLNIKSGSIDFIDNYNSLGKASNGFEFIPAKTKIGVNPYHFNTQFSGKALSFLQEIMPPLNLEGTDDTNFDKSDSMTDYFHVGWYIDVNIGQWNKPYQWIS